MDRYYKAALAFAKDFGWDRDELPRGNRGDNHTCPLGIACGQLDNWQQAYWTADVAAFILRFDQGMYPDLIADKD